MKAFTMPIVNSLEIRANLFFTIGMASWNVFDDLPFANCEIGLEISKALGNGIQLSFTFPDGQLWIEVQVIENEN